MIQLDANKLLNILKQNHSSLIFQEIYRLFEKSIADLESLLPDLYEKVNILAFSGGKDSMLLLILLLRFNIEHRKKLLFRICHVNHNIRYESSLEASAIKDMATSLGLAYTIYDLSYDLLSELSKENGIEAAARTLRYACFSRLINGILTEKTYKEERIDFSRELFLIKNYNEDCDRVYSTTVSPYIFLAHHKNDLIETIFLNIFRGSGIDGISSLMPINGRLVRPLLRLDRKLIDDFFDESEIDFIQDESNFSDQYKRNEVRNKILPYIDSVIGTDYRNNILKLYDNACEQRNINRQMTERFCTLDLIDDEFEFISFIYKHNENVDSLSSVANFYLKLKLKNVLADKLKLSVSKINLDSVIDAIVQKSRIIININRATLFIAYFKQNNESLITIDRDTQTRSFHSFNTEIKYRGLCSFFDISSLIQIKDINDLKNIKLPRVYKGSEFIADKYYYPLIQEAVWRKVRNDDKILFYGKLNTLKNFAKKKAIPSDLFSNLACYAIGDRIIFLPGIFCDLDYLLENECSYESSDKYWHFAIYESKNTLI